MRITWRTIGALFVFLLITFAAAALGGYFTAQGVNADWYRALSRPPWQPPDALFSPVWTILYTLMAVSAWLVWRERGVRRAAVPFALFTMQLVLNVGWTALFFTQRALAAAFVEILLLWVLILATTIAFWRVRPLAGWLFLPYLLWVAYASTLNFWYWQRG
jgi:tryptophan-rich sensory protein